MLALTVTHYLKNIELKILFFAFIAIGCQEKKEPKIDVSQESQLRVSTFDLKTEYEDFKKQMTELDTISIFVDHSVCTYEGYERLRITKKSDSIKILSEFKDYDKQDPKWEKVYEKNISKNDTIWNFGKFMKKNESRLNSNTDENVTIEIKNGEQKLKFVTKGLVDLNRFIADYGNTMLKLTEPNQWWFYGILEINESELNDE